MGVLWTVSCHFVFSPYHRVFQMSFFSRDVRTGMQTNLLDHFLLAGAYSQIVRKHRFFIKKWKVFKSIVNHCRNCVFQFALALVWISPGWTYWPRGSLVLTERVVATMVDSICVGLPFLWTSAAECPFFGFSTRAQLFLVMQFIR
jgi:hypothetical protein